MQSGDESLPSFALAGSGILVKMLINLKFACFSQFPFMRVIMLAF